MRVYIDTGVFIDYLARRGHAGGYLRTAERRGRTPNQLAADAEDCFSRLQRWHTALTSALTFFELEEALFGQLSRAASGISHASIFVIPSARAVVVQMETLVGQFGVQVIDLSFASIQRLSRNIDLQVAGLRAGDTLHMTTAMAENADVMLTGDTHLLALDGSYSNAGGTAIRCWDTDEALNHL